MRLVGYLKKKSISMHVNMNVKTLIIVDKSWGATLFFFSVEQQPNLVQTASMLLRFIDHTPASTPLNK